ncbi:hypothetical protein AB1N83_014069, partial [Pleurotus pulmonarius]
SSLKYISKRYCQR